MKFRIAGFIGALTLLILGTVSVSAQADPAIGERGTLSNGRQVATVEVSLSCDFTETDYAVHVRIAQPSGRTLAEGVGSVSGTCIEGERVTVDVEVPTLSSPFKPGPATVFVEVHRSWCDAEYNCDFDFPDTTVSATVKFNGQ